MKNVVLSVFALSLLGCGGGSDSGNSLLDTVTTVVQESDEDDYKKSEYRFYGVFTGSTGEGASSVVTEFIIDDSSSSFTSIIIAGSLERFKFKKGTFTKAQDEFTSNSTVYSIDEDFASIESTDIGYRLHFNYESEEPFLWSINGAGMNSVLEFEASNAVTSLNPREIIFPAKFSFFDSDFVSEIIYSNENLITSITVDSDGDISGSDSQGCVFTGSSLRGNKHVNSYPVTVTIENCSNPLNNGSYSGLMAKSGFNGERSTLTDRVEGDATNITLMLYNQNRAIYLSLERN